MRTTTTTAAKSRWADAARPSAEAARLRAASLAPNTISAYEGALKRLEDALGMPVAQMTDLDLANHLAARHGEGAAPPTVGLVVAAVGCWARLAGARSPVGPATRSVLGGARREGRGRGRGRAAGIRWADADAMSAAAERARTLVGARDAALIGLLSDAMLRISEAAAASVADLSAEGDGSGRLAVRHSKTDQAGRGAALYVGPPTMGRVARWMEAGGIADGPLFRRVHPDGRIGAALSPQSVRMAVRRWAGRCGVRGRVSGHSLRVGAAESLAEAGAGLVEMQVAGRWSSPSMPGRYAAGQLAARGAVARLRHGR